MVTTVPIGYIIYSIVSIYIVYYTIYVYTTKIGDIDR